MIGEKKFEKQITSVRIRESLLNIPSILFLSKLACCNRFRSLRFFLPDNVMFARGLVLQTAVCKTVNTQFT